MCVWGGGGGGGVAKYFKKLIFEGSEQLFGTREYSVLKICIAIFCLLYFSF